jgi:SpoVK/Ycf46/Vps4 family AAA+-type ATPase
MAENKSQVFLVATANNIEQLPPELIRKGRMDEVFFVDLPSQAVREEIFNIHAGKRDVDKNNIDFKQLALLTEGFSGAEIEQLVVSAIYSSFSADAKPGMEDLVREIEVTKPLSVLMGEKITALRGWAKNRTVPAD